MLAAAALALATTFSPGELALLAGLTAGAGVLRLLVSVLQEGPTSDALTTSLDQLTQALGLVPTSNTLVAAGAKVVPQELPLTDAQQDRPYQRSRNKVHYDTNGERTDGKHLLVHGRDYSVGQMTTVSGRGPSYYGPWHLGTASRAPSVFYARTPISFQPRLPVSLLQCSRPA